MMKLGCRTPCRLWGSVAGVQETPRGLGGTPPQDAEIRASGLALLFPQIEGIQIQRFHFTKDPKNLILKRHQLLKWVFPNFVWSLSWAITAGRWESITVGTLAMSIILAGGRADNLSSRLVRRTLWKLLSQVWLDCH